MADPYMLGQRFGSLEEMAARVRHWDIEFQPLAADRGGTALTQVALGPLLLSHLDTDCAHVHRGASPPKAKTFGLLADGNQTVHWCRQRLDMGRMPFFEPAQEFEASAHPRFNIYTLTLDAARLDADPAWQPEPNRRRRGPAPQRRLFRVDPRALAALRQRIAAALELCGGQFGDAADRAYGAMGEDIADCLRSMIAAAVPGREAVSAGARARAVRRSLDYLQQSPGELMRVSQLSEFAQVSERTLERAFLEHFGVTPKAYLKAEKLHRIRARLLESAPGESLIRDLALAEGFWHMGQFAQDYRRLFGELPSQTLTREPRSGARGPARTG